MAARLVVDAVAAYLGLGLLLALAFAALGPGRALPEAGRVTLGARLLILPGVALLWPLVAARWLGRP